MLSKRLKKMYDQTREGMYAVYRDFDYSKEEWELKSETRTPYQTMAEFFRMICRNEKPVIIPGDRLFFTRTLKGKDWIPCKWTRIENLTADWEMLLTQGLDGRIAVAQKKLQESGLPEEGVLFLQSSIDMMNEVKAFSERYAECALANGDVEGAALLRKVPAKPAETLREALQAVFFMFSMFHHTGVRLQGLGRMDQYLFPYYEQDLKNHRLTRDEAGELISEFFIMLNRENDVYGQIQRGDDGESVVLGGCRRDGTPAYNDLTKLILECSCDVCMINPKINLRVNQQTPADILEAGVRLTRRGLGFPQYENDEVVIPALIHFGYPVEDARDYTVAACWEFVLKNGRDIPNFEWCNLALLTDNAIRTALRERQSFDQLLENIKVECKAFAGSLPVGKWENMIPNPLFSAFCGACIERGKDLHRGGGDHYHAGCLSVGSSTAADSLIAIKRLVYDEKTVTPERYLHALETNFQNEEDLCALLKTLPKTGDNSPESNHFLTLIFDAFCEALEEIEDNGLGGRWRPGTGSAHAYAFLTQKDNPNRVHATADGRKDGDYLSSSLAPSPGVRSPGVLSVLQTYGHLNYERLCNGGPITMEFAPAYFKSEESIQKTAEIIRIFVKTGCQQLQMNVLDRAMLEDAQKHPELHRDLIVRVWGWSGYFVELEPLFQNQIIGRQAFGE